MSLNTFTRRRALTQIAGTASALALGPLTGCGGGSGSGDAGDTSTSGASGTSASSSGTSGSSASNTPTSGTTPTWPWTTATSTTARVQKLSDFVTVVASGSVNYAFHTSISSSTSDPVTGLTTDTTSAATLQPFLMGKYLVTNANWKAFCNAMGASYWPTTANASGQYWYGGAYPAGKEDHPVFFVSLTAARAYCAWLETQISGYRFYVPTEGEWEYAALGNNSAWSYPWGTAARLSYAGSSLSSPFNCNAVCTAYVLSAASGLSTLSYFNDSTVTTLSDGSTALTDDTAPLTRVLSLSSSGSVTGWQYDSDTNKTWADFANSDQFRELVYVYGGYSSAVGAYAAGASWCGCHDMAGNAYEWTSTQNLASNGAETGTMVNAIKGGSWYATSSSGKSTGRGEGRSASGAYHSVGFRVAARLL